MKSSQRYVNFIGSLIPLYQQEFVNEKWCARSLRDGTVLLPQEQLDDGLDDRWITVWWQGDRHRESELTAPRWQALL